MRADLPARDLPYWGDDEPLATVIERMWRLEQGGTFAVFLGCDALAQGLSRAHLHVQPLRVRSDVVHAAARRHRRAARSRSARRRATRGQHATDGYLEFLERGGRLRFADLSQHLIRGILRCRLPIITGLSSTYLYRSAREFGRTDTPDDVRGIRSGTSS